LEFYRNINPGDISKQLEIRKKLNCKPFKWFMEKVAYDLPKYYPPVVPPPYAQGEVFETFKTKEKNINFKS
jgi:polypeptide N-acetylgalactosaminyltransferase